MGSSRLWHKGNWDEEIPDDILISHRRLAANAMPFSFSSLYFAFKVHQVAALFSRIRVCIRRNAFAHRRHSVFSLPLFRDL